MNDTFSCRICLATDNVKLYNLNDMINLKSEYENITGTQISATDGLSQQICCFCSTLLLKYISFKEKCCYTQGICKYLLRNQKKILTEDILLIQKQLTYLSQSNILPIIDIEYKEPTIKEEFEVNIDSVITLEEITVKKEKLEDENNQDIEVKVENFGEEDMNNEIEEDSHVEAEFLPPSTESVKTVTMALANNKDGVSQRLMETNAMEECSDNNNVNLAMSGSSNLSFKTNFDRKLVKYDEQHQGSHRKAWTWERILEIIKHIKKARVTMSSGQRRTAMDYYWMGKYEILKTANEDCLIFKRLTATAPAVRILPREHYFDVLLDIHKSCGHGGRDKIMYDIKNRYYIPKKAVEIFVSLCPICAAKRKTKKRHKGVEADRIA